MHVLKGVGLPRRDAIGQVGRGAAEVGQQGAQSGGVDQDGRVADRRPCGHQVQRIRLDAGCAVGCGMCRRMRDRRPDAADTPALTRERRRHSPPVSPSATIADLSSGHASITRSEGSNASSSQVMDVEVTCSKSDPTSLNDTHHEPPSRNTNRTGQGSNQDSNGTCNDSTHAEGGAKDMADAGCVSEGFADAWARRCCVMAAGNRGRVEARWCNQRRSTRCGMLPRIPHLVRCGVEIASGARPGAVPLTPGERSSGKVYHWQLTDYGTCRVQLPVVHLAVNRSPGAKGTHPPGTSCHLYNGQGGYPR